jgi:hypothetical protein
LRSAPIAGLSALNDSSLANHVFRASNCGRTNWTLIPNP